MPYQVLINAIKNQIKMASEITATEQKEGQCDGEENEKCELEVFKQENAEVLEEINRLHMKYHSELEQAITDFDEIEIYESYVEELYNIIFNLIQRETELRVTDPQQQQQQQQPVAKLNDSVINAMDLKPPPPVDNGSDNINETKSETPVNLRHQQLNNNDLHEQQEELNELKIKNETMGKEFKRLHEAESFGKTLDCVFHENDSETAENRLTKLEAANVQLKEELAQKDEELVRVRKCNQNDLEALIYEIAHKHDHIGSLRFKIRKLEERIEELERKVQFREKIIRELRRVPKTIQHPQSISPIPTPPRTPELLKTSRSSTDLIYRGNYLTVPQQLNNNNISGDSLYSLSDIDQESKSMSEVNFDCFEDANKYEIERLHHSMGEIESENNCNRLLITKLEDELVMLRKCESRNKQDRNLKTDKLNVLCYKIKSIASKVLEKGAEEVSKPKLHHTELAIIEDELKPEYDVLNNLMKLVTKTKSNLEKISNENRELQSTIGSLKSEMMELQKRIEHVPKTQCDDERKESEKQMEQLIIDNCESVSKRHVARVLSNLFGKEISPDAIDQITSSSPEIGGSGDSSLNGHSSLSDVINDWKRELQEKNLELRHTLERLHDKELEICEIRNEFKAAQIERDENCQMVHQLKDAIQYHNESIQFLKRQNAELKQDLDDKKN